MAQTLDIAAEKRIGDLLREWRQHRRLSQLDLSLDAGISQRHLSFIESGRAQPSREMILRLADTLQMPLRQRNRMLLAAGFAPSFPERGLEDPLLRPAMDAVRLVLDGHAPNPAIAIDRHWTMIAANEAIAPLLEGVSDPALLAAPVNALRLSLHPQGLAPRILNLAEWRAHVIERLRQLQDRVPDPTRAALEAELAAYPVPAAKTPPHTNPASMIAVPLRLRHGAVDLSFITTTTIFGAPLDVTLSEIAIESFFPADETTARFLRDMQAQRATRERKRADGSSL